jgi:hypothetical protein
MIHNELWSKKDNMYVSYLFLGFISVVATNILIVNTLNTLALIPIIIILFLMSVKNSKVEITLKISSVTLGFLVTIAFWSIYAHFVGFRFRFWQPLLDTFINYSSGYHQVWHKSFFDLWWLNLNYGYISAIFVAMFGSLWYLTKILRVGFSDINDVLRLFKTDLLFFVSYTTFIVNATWIISYIMKLHILEYDYHALPAIFFSTLWILVLFSDTLEKILKYSLFLKSIVPIILPFFSLIIAYYSLVSVEIARGLTKILTKNTVIVSLSLLIIILIFRKFKSIASLKNSIFTTLVLLLASMIGIFVSLNLLNIRYSSGYDKNGCQTTREATFSIVEWVLSTKSYEPIYVFFDPKDILYRDTSCAYPIEYLANSLVMTGKFKMSFPMGSNPEFSADLVSNQQLIGILTSNKLDKSFMNDVLKVNSFNLIEKLPIVDVDQNDLFPTLEVYSRNNL